MKDEPYKIPAGIFTLKEDNGGINRFHLMFQVDKTGKCVVREGAKSNFIFEEWIRSMQHQIQAISLPIIYRDTPLFLQ